MAQNEPLRWQAQDADDLIAISSAVQDGIVQVGEIRFDKTSRSLTLLLSRFRWELPDYGKGQRIACALRIDSLLDVQSKGIARANPQALAVLLAIEFTPDDEPPGGQLKLIFAGDGEMRARVECIDVTLIDVSPSRATRLRPTHDLDER